MQQPVYVDSKLFLGRVQQQTAFRTALSELFHHNNDNQNPYIILLHGDGGMGKTTLSKRFRDIALREQPYQGEFDYLWIDWEAERRTNARLQIGHDNISAETILATIHSAATRKEWGHHFKRYQKLVTQKLSAEKAASKALERDWGEQTATLRGLSSDAIGKLARIKAPIVGETGEKWISAAAGFGLDIAADQIQPISEAIQTRLRSRLNPEQYDLFMQPEETLARALADGLKNCAQRKRLLLVLDTYEVADAADGYLRSVIKTAGERVVWLISGRNNLAKSGNLGGAYVMGYKAEFDPRVLEWSMPELAIADVQAYFADSVPDRPIDEAEALALSEATRGIPLAIEQAAEMWAQGTALEDIVGDTTRRTPANEIVNKMTERYLLHTVKAPEDKLALYALALAKGKRKVLHAMLRPDDAAETFDLTARLEQLQRAYASVHLEEARLHDEPAAFFQAYLRREGERERPQVRTLYERAATVARAELAELDEELPLIEERCEDEEWIEWALDLTRFLLATDEREAWQWVIPRFVEGLAYSRELRVGLLDILGMWESSLSRRSRLRLRKLQAGMNHLDGKQAMLEGVSEAQVVARWLG